MSAHFLLRYRGHYCQVIGDGDNAVLLIVDRAEATSFISEAEAWAAACRHHLHPDFVSVENTTP